MVMCVDCQLRPAMDGVLCSVCMLKHAERAQQHQMRNDALAWAFVTLVFIVLVVLGLHHAFPHGVQR